MACQRTMSLSKEAEYSAKNSGEFRFSSPEKNKQTKNEHLKTKQQKDLSVSFLHLLINLSIQVLMSWLQCSKYCSKFFTHIIILK